MAGGDHGSLTKEPPLSTLDATIRAIKPGMQYSALLAYAKNKTHSAAPGLAKQRFLIVNNDGSIAYDQFLSLAAAHRLDAPRVRKAMYFLWAYRDDRIRRFVCEKIANKAGTWSVPRLRNKANAKFFEKWLQPGAARKARSNFERFLVEAKIFDPELETIDLDLNDGWLEQATIIAAQHEKDISAREELLANPVKFLESRGWLGLLNTSYASAPKVSPILFVDSIPLEDEIIKVKPSNTQTSSDWGRSGPVASGKKLTTVSIDLIARERANFSHFQLEKLLAGFARAKGFAPKYNQNIDLYFETKSGSVLVEIKSCTDGNFHSQLRKAVSQLLEYRFVYRNIFKSEVTMLLLMETAPSKGKTWLVNYAKSLGIIVAWGHPTKSILTTLSIPESLTGLVRKVKQTV